MDKTILGCRVYAIAEKYNITQVTVHAIVNGYADYCKELLLSGAIVNILGIVDIVPDVVLTEYNTTLAYDCKYIADKLGLPHHTVYVIIKEYLDSLREDILNGKTAEIRGIVTIHPLYEDGQLLRIHSAISLSIKKLIQNSNTNIKSARVHTNKMLKDDISSLLAI